MTKFICDYCGATTRTKDDLRRLPHTGCPERYGEWQEAREDGFCPGCMEGLPLKGTLHYKGEEIVMVCHEVLARRVQEIESR